VWAEFSAVLISNISWNLRNRFVNFILDQCKLDLIPKDLFKKKKKNYCVLVYYDMAVPTFDRINRHKNGSIIRKCLHDFRLQSQNRALERHLQLKKKVVKYSVDQDSNT
jgi:hypothetical protein